MHQKQTKKQKIRENKLTESLVVDGITPLFFDSQSEKSVSEKIP